MSLSSQHSPSHDQVLSDSNSRYHNRFNERFKSLTNSPPEETVPIVLKSSPIIPAHKPEQKIFEGEKYDSYKIQNQDRGEWRESEVLNSSPRQQPHTVKKATGNERKVPQYMQATESFYNRLQSKDKPSKNDHILRARSQGGITKKTTALKSLRSQSNAAINAIHKISKKDINNDNAYVPFAVRVKLFEKGLGNGSNKPVKSSSSSTKSSQTSVKSNGSHGNSTTHRQSTTSSIPHYAQETSIFKIRQELQQTKATQKQSETKNKSNSLKV